MSNEEYLHYINESEDYAEINYHNKNKEYYEDLYTCSVCMDKFTDVTHSNGNYFCYDCIDEKGEHIQFIMQELMCQLFHQTDENAEMIVELFTQEHPEILECYTKEELMKL